MHSISRGDWKVDPSLKMPLFLEAARLPPSVKMEAFLNVGTGSPLKVVATSLDEDKCTR